MLTWPAKDADEVLDYSWTPAIDAGDTLASATLTLISGAVTINSQSIISGSVVIWLSGGTVGQCLFRGRATTANGRTFEDYIALSIVNKPVDSNFAGKAALTSAITAWLKGNTTLTSHIPDFIRLTEARLNRLLRDPDQIAAATLNLTSGSATLPSDFGEIVQFGDSGGRVRQVTPAEFGAYNPLSGNPRVYAISAGSIRVNPGSGSATTPITYYRAITPLVADGDTNWLLTRAPDLYLYGTLLQAEFFGWNDERLPLIKNAFDEAIGELRADGASRRWGPAMAPRLGRT